MQLAELFARADDGPLMPQDQFVMRRLVPALRSSIKDLDITWDKNTFVNSDDGLADRVFEAALRLLETVGVYCPNSDRVMEFSAAEIAAAVAGCPEMVEFGEGAERQTLRARRPDSTARPWVHVGGGMNVSDETVYLRTVEGMAAIVAADSIAAPSLPLVEGKPARAGSPQEIMAAVRAVALTRDGLRRAGRPGLPVLNAISTVAASSTMFAATHPEFGMRPSDGYLIDFLAEMIAGYESLQRVAYFTTLGAPIASVATPMYGGYAGGAEGVAVLATAYMVAGRLLFRSCYHFNAPLHSRLLVVTAKPMLWANSLANQAITRNMPMSIFNTAYLAGGSGTRTSHLETAAYLLAVVSSGGHVYTGHAGSAAQVDSLLPIDHEFQAEIGLAAAGVSRAEANRMVAMLYPLYESHLASPEPGRTYDEAYDRSTGRLTAKDLEVIREDVRGELVTVGVRLTKTL